MKNILKWNPELAKNIWLELSRQRLIVMPLVIAMVSLLIIMNAGNKEREILHYVSLAGFILIGMVWGIKNAADAVLDEHNDKTWDWQRMSVIGPWKLAWGKLFGNTIYNWYGAMMCFVIYLFTSFSADNPLQEMKIGLLLILGMISVHGLMMMISLQLIKKSDDRKKIKSNGIFIAGLILTGFLARLFTTEVLYHFQSKISWYGLTSDPVNISIITTIFYCGWIIAGLYRTMRAELQFADTPVWWITFIVSSFFLNYGYFAGAEQISFSTGMATALFFCFIEFLFIIYFLALSEPKDLVSFRILVNAWKNKNRPAFLQNIPLWLVTLPFTFLYGLLAAVFFQFTHFGQDLRLYFDSEIFGTGKAFFALAAILGFTIRDLGILLILHFSRRSRRADGAMIIYLCILYFLLPQLTDKIGIGAMFYPDLNANIFLMTLFPLTEAVVVLYFLSKQWKKSSLKNLSNEN